MTLQDFISKLKDFDNLFASNKIDYFVYFLTIVQGIDGISSKDINNCYDEIKSVKYSNIPAYLNNNSKKVKNKRQKFILKKGLFHLERSRQIEIEEELGTPKLIPPSNNYFPLDILNHTRSYLQWVANQAAGCYDNGFYDACYVMTRKLLEILIIETFERHSLADKIKNTEGNFFYLSDLIDKLNAERSWNIGRNAKQGLTKIKKKGDLSAHNRRYIARQIEVDEMKEDLRIVLEELVHLIDYPNWHK
ncbi:DUF4145 domain-containing protein [Chitinophaga solisilvae]|uniref:DUF4145 domain-containing protein n=1 Tax=Chitinophaga solisilvae TaxID=1233460 RepID=UPI00136A339C|nr:DUF4145 domain-containing protein [Chitinophaga solisilvae]